MANEYRRLIGGAGGIGVRRQDSDSDVVMIGGVSNMNQGGTLTLSSDASLEVVWRVTANETAVLQALETAKSAIIRFYAKGQGN